MPLLDHFRQPLATERPWDGFHSTWAGTMATLLNQRHLPADYFAIPLTRLGGGIEVDVGTFHRNGGSGTPGPAVAAAVWAPPAAPLRATVDYLDQDVFEVRIHQQLGGPQLRAAVELVSPANKDRPGHRPAFAVKCAGYLQQGVSVVVDVVTERQANLHMEILEVLELAAELPWGSPTHLYAVAYRTTVSPGHQQLEAWSEPLTIGAELPTLPLWLEPDLPLPLRLEESYTATCAALKIPS